MERTFDSESNDVAMEEASHAAKFASLLGKVKDTKTNLVNMLIGEMQAEKDKARAAKVAFTEGNQEDSFKITGKRLNQL
jgi:rubrerythrin